MASATDSIVKLLNDHNIVVALHYIVCQTFVMSYVIFLQNDNRESLVPKMTMLAKITKMKQFWDYVMRM